MRSPAMLRIALVLVFAAACQAANLYFVNGLEYPIWVGTKNTYSNNALDGGGWEMEPGAEVVKETPNFWAGQLWARTGCDFDADGAGSCEVGDCGNGLKCAGAGPMPPVTLVNMLTSQYLDQYSVNISEGFNVPISIVPLDEEPEALWCRKVLCESDINAVCPSELQVEGEEGVVACESACTAFDTDEYCCRGEYSDCNPEEWETNYSKIFKEGCPGAITYTSEGQSVSNCMKTDYLIYFGVYEEGDEEGVGGEEEEEEKEEEEENGE